jgi:putative ribosome biogenesis GTPase RsgA
VLNADLIVWFAKHSDTEYFRTMRGAVEAAMTDWIQVQSNQRLKQYDFKHPQATYAVPDWSEYSTEDDAQNVFTALFANRVITEPEPDHDILERLRGRKISCPCG